MLSRCQLAEEIDGGDNSMCKTCDGAKVTYQFKGAMMMLGPCPTCNPQAKKEVKEGIRPYENSRG